MRNVVVSGANVGVLPLLSRDPDADAPDRHADPREERRLRWCGCTRADAGCDRWRVGQRVRHARYGAGTITAIAGDTIACDFGKLGPRAFPRAMCPLV